MCSRSCFFIITFCNKILIFLVMLCIIIAGDEIESMLDRYEKMLVMLPKGTLVGCEKNGRTYYYLKYRNGKKVVSKYVGKASVETIAGQIEKRKHIEAMIKSLKEELGIAEKALEGNI